jgi:hypothetical protein
MTEEKQHGTPCITLNCPNRVGDGVFVGDLCSPCHTYLTTMQGKHSQLYRNTREKNMLGSYSRFRALLEISATYETLYTDNGGRQIVVIQPLDMFCFFNKLFAEPRNEAS